MAFNPKTYPLAEYSEMRQLWKTIVHSLSPEGFDNGAYWINDKIQECVYISAFPTKQDAVTLSHHLNRYRSARRAQTPLSETLQDPGPHDWDFVLLQTVELENGQWAVKASSRNQMFKKLNLKILDKEGNTL